MKYLLILLLGEKMQIRDFLVKTFWGDLNFVITHAFVLDFHSKHHLSIEWYEGSSNYIKCRHGNYIFLLNNS